MRKRVLAVASGGGHWVQLMRLAPALDVTEEVVYASSHPGCASDVPDNEFYCVGDASRWNPGKVLVVGIKVMWVVLRVRPGVVITTGAAPGLIAIVIGRLSGARTLWLDSIANVDEVSLSGRAAIRCAHLALTQWEHLAGKDDSGCEWRGAVL